jgi:hypothetical protein
MPSYPADRTSSGDTSSTLSPSRWGEIFATFSAIEVGHSLSRVALAKESRGS